MNITDLERAIINAYNVTNIDEQTEDIQKYYKKCLDKLCDMKDPKAIQDRGYCYYSGCNIYPQDWFKARDSFLEYYEMTGDASAANTLGYIYYYGRCNGGTPEYDLAFRYFSIGHANGYFESTYKLADMFSHGYSVKKNDEIAFRLYWSIYDENLHRFVEGETGCKFADIALRIGNAFRDGIGCKKSDEQAFYYYLQADLAIRMRQQFDYYGDKKVMKNVAGELEAARERYLESYREKLIEESEDAGDDNFSVGFRNKFERKYPFWVDWFLRDDWRCQLRVIKSLDGALTLDISTRPMFYDLAAPMNLITIPEANYCALLNKIRIRTAPGSKYDFDTATSIIFDHVEFNEDTGVSVFYLDGEKCGEITTEKYIFNVSAEQSTSLI